MCRIFLDISHRLNCGPPPYGPTVWGMSREWLAVSSFTGTIPWAARAAFCSNSRTENRRCHCYIAGAMGRVDSKLFRPCAPSDTVPRLLTFRFRVFRFAICPRRLLFLPAVIRTRFISGQCAPRSFFNGNNNDEDGNGNRRWRSIANVVIPPPPDSIHRISRGGNERMRKKRGRDGRVVCELIDGAWNHR